MVAVRRISATKEPTTIPVSAPVPKLPVGARSEPELEFGSVLWVGDEVETDGVRVLTDILLSEETDNDVDVALELTGNGIDVDVDVDVDVSLGDREDIEDDSVIAEEEVDGVEVEIAPVRVTAVTVIFGAVTDEDGDGDEEVDSMVDVGLLIVPGRTITVVNSVIVTVTAALTS
jgi:hypothetical protein